MTKKTRKQKILDLIEARQHQLHYEHEREYLATLIDNMAQKEVNKISSNLPVSGTLFAFMKWYQENNSAVWGGIESEIKRYLKANNFR